MQLKDLIEVGMILFEANGNLEKAKKLLESDRTEEVKVPTLDTRGTLTIKSRILLIN